MFERINEVLPRLQQLPVEAQEEVVASLEVLIEALEREAVARGRLARALPARPLPEPWHDPAGAWHDLPDSMLADLDRLRHAVPPTPPIDFQ